MEEKINEQIKRKMKPLKFKVSPRKWYDYINPWWYQKSKILEEVINWQMNSQAVNDEIQERLKNSLLYGEFVTDDDLRDIRDEDFY